MATSSIEVTNGSNCSNSQSFASRRVNSLDDPLVFDENSLKIMSELASNISAVQPPHNKVFSKCLSQINSSNESKDHSSASLLTDGIEDLFEAYNISSDDLTNRYKIAEEHITNELNEMFVERERLRGQMQPFMNSTGGGAQSTLHVCYVPAIASSNSDSQSVIGGSLQDSATALKLSGKVNSNSPDLLSSCFTGIARASNVANSVLENIQIKDECGSLLDPPVNLEAKEDPHFSIPRSDVMEKSLFINLSFKAGFNSAGWDSSPPPFNNGKDVENGAKSIYRCVECGAAYASRTALFYHYRRRLQNVKQFQCNKCVLPISNECASRAHSRFHFLTGPFICFICGESCSGDSMLLQHIDTHGVECRIQNNIACHACRLVFISKEHLMKHRHSSHCIAACTDVSASSNGGLLKTDPHCLKLRVTSENEGKDVPSVNSSALNCAISASVGFGSNSHKSSCKVSSSSSSFVPMKKPSSSSVGNNPNTVPMTTAVVSNGTTCHLCQKVLSRRDKLKWHLAICAPRFQVDLYDHLLLAGFSESVARNVVLGSNCAVRCRKCSARFSTRSGLEEHESVCAPDPNRSDVAATTALKGIGEETKQATNFNGVSLSSSSVAPSSINSVAVSDRKGAQLGGVMSSPNAVLANGGSANVGNSCSTLKQASQQQLPAMDRLTCHLCNRTLSRRDKLKRHLVRCCEMYGRDVEIALNVAGFTSKDVDKILGINNSVAINGSTLNNVGTLSAPLPTQCPPSSLQNIDTFAFEDVGAIPQGDGCGLVTDVSKKPSSVISAPPVRPVATEKLTKYHLSPENIPVPPSFSADISSLVSPTNTANDLTTFAGSSGSNSAIISPKVAITATAVAANNANLLVAASLSSSLSQNIQSCQLFSCSPGTTPTTINSSALDSNFNFTIYKNSHNQTAVPSLAHVPLFSSISTASSVISNGHVSSVSTSGVTCSPSVKPTPPVSSKVEVNEGKQESNGANEQLDLEMGELLQEIWDKKPCAKRTKYNCEKCGELFSYKLAFSKHSCHEKSDTTK